MRCGVVSSICGVMRLDEMWCGVIYMWCDEMR